MAEGTTTVINGFPFYLVREAIRVGVDLLKWSEEMRFSLNLHHLFIVMVENPNVVSVWDGRWWPIDHVAV